VARLHEAGLAHGNVEARSLLLSGLHDTARVVPLFVGLVEPSFNPAKKWEDVQKLAALSASFIGRARTDLVAADLRADVEKLRAELEHIGSTEAREAVPIQLLVHRFSRTLALLDGNFAIVQKNAGDVFAYADLLVRHALYAKLFLRERE
jgi:hypothetical protein